MPLYERLRRSAATSTTLVDVPYFDRIDGVGAMEAVCRRLTRHVAQASTVVDVGCGTGALVDRFRRSGVDALGVDPSADLVGAAIDRYGHHFHRAGAEKLPFADESIDATTLMRVVHHLDAPRTALRETLRVLRPEGTAVVTEMELGFTGAPEPCPEGMNAVMHDLTGGDPRANGLGPFVPALFKQAGFIDVSIDRHAVRVTDPDEALAWFNVDPVSTAGAVRAWAETLAEDMKLGARALQVTGVHYVARRPALTHSTSATGSATSTQAGRST